VVTATTAFGPYNNGWDEKSKMIKCKKKKKNREVL
jgi:hypothetical protein